MSRPWQIWTAAIICLALVVAALGWLSLRAIESDRAEQTARAQAAVEENVRLALWRMDTRLAALVADENMRPTYNYTPVLTISTRSPETKSGLNESVFLCSPLLNDKPAEIRGYFQLDANGEVTSPSLPPLEWQEKLTPKFYSTENLQPAKTDLDEIRALLRKRDVSSFLAKHLNEDSGWGFSPNDGEQQGGQYFVAGSDSKAEPVQVFNGYLANTEPNTSFSFGQETLPNAVDTQSNGNVPTPQNGSRYINPQNDLTRNSRQQSLNAAPENPPRQQAQVDSEPPNQDTQLLRSQSEFQQRAAYVGNNATLRNSWSNNTEDVARVNKLWASNFISTGDLKSSQPIVQVSRMLPIWIDDDLLLIRRVSINGKNLTQGCWLNWSEIRKELLTVIADLLPNADLGAVAETKLEGPRMLASLPIRLLPGELPNAKDDLPLSPLRWSLILTWSSLGIAVVGAALLGNGIIGLSERRAAFVSAVTHELRTPLTTFRMYSEMLSEDMVPDDETRRNYARTLHHESDRLSHMVENVLSYARLERGADGGRRTTMTVERLADLALDRALGRAAQAEFEPVIELAPEIAAQKLHVDAGAVEQIAFNLVDNAAKYAGSAADRRLHLEFALLGRKLLFRVGDHGPGIARADRSGLFLPFRKSAARAAVSAPGVGLGLSLCRRMARAMGGELRYLERSEGAWFELELPTGE